MNDEIIFLHKILEGGTNRSYGIQVARLAGLPEKIIRRAKKVLSNIETNGYVLGGRAESRAAGKLPESGQVQLNLFQTPDQAVMETLQKVDIASMTPLEALNYLSMLKEKACGKSAAPGVKRISDR